VSSWRIGLDTVSQLREVRGDKKPGIDIRYMGGPMNLAGPGGVAPAPAPVAAPDPAAGPDAGAAPAPATGLEGLAKFTDKVTKWIPGDALVLYLLGISLFATPNPYWLWIMTVVAGLLVVGAAFATGEEIRKEVWVSAVLASVAFAIWSLPIPSSGWQKIPGIESNKFIVSLAGAVAGSLFALVAEGITRRMARAAAG
jgi:hypothetical protein